MLSGLITSGLWRWSSSLGWPHFLYSRTARWFLGARTTKLFPPFLSLRERLSDTGSSLRGQRVRSAPRGVHERASGAGRFARTVMPFRRVIRAKLLAGSRAITITRIMIVLINGLLKGPLRSPRRCHSSFCTLSLRPRLLAHCAVPELVSFFPRAVLLTQKMCARRGRCH